MKKKIPGTLYEVEFGSNGGTQYLAGLWYRKEKVAEKSGLDKSMTVEWIFSELVKANLQYPKNRIQNLVDECIKTLTPPTESFLESTVSKVMEEYQQTNTDITKIILMGLGNAGKTCIYERIFEGKTPWELVHSAATKGISYKNYDVNENLKPVIWDLGGQIDYRQMYHNKLSSQIFSKASVLLYIVDVSDVEKHEESKEELAWAAQKLMEANPSAKIFVFLHKIDTLNDRSAVIESMKLEFGQSLPTVPRFLPTSIFDESLFRAWSEIIQQLYPKSKFLKIALNKIKDQEGIKDVLLVTKSTGLTVGSTLAENDEEILVGMSSLLTITIDRILKELQSKQFYELLLRSDGFSLWISEISNSDLLLVFVIDPRLDPLDAKYMKIKNMQKEFAEQIKKMW